MTLNNPPDGGSQVIPVFGIKPEQVQDAYLAYAAVVRMGREDPSLRSNPYFTALQDAAFSRFSATFEAMQ